MPVHSTGSVSRRPSHALDPAHLTADMQETTSQKQACGVRLPFAMAESPPISPLQLKRARAFPASLIAIWHAT
eukprot:2102419-Amphidinium_carterae.1